MAERRAKQTYPVELESFIDALARLLVETEEPPKTEEQSGAQSSPPGEQEP